MPEIDMPQKTDWRADLAHYHSAAGTLERKRRNFWRKGYKKLALWGGVAGALLAYGFYQLVSQ